MLQLFEKFIEGDDFNVFGVAPKQFKRLFPVVAVRSAADLEAPDYVLKAILGHSDKSITANYGHGAKLAVRQSYVDRVHFDVVALKELIQRERIGGE